MQTNRVLPYVGMIFVVFFFSSPLLWFMTAAFKTQVQAFAVPPIFLPDFSYLENFKIIIEESGSFLVNSIIITLGSTILCLIFSLPTAFGIVMFNFRARNFLADWILSTRMMPPIAVAVPIFIAFNNLGLLDTHAGLILVYAGFNISFAVWVSMSFFRNIPKEVIEAARIEGCSWPQVFRLVALPLSMNGIGTVATFVFIFSWNELLLALFLTVREAKTFPVVITNFIAMGQVQWELIAAASVILATPPIVFTLIMQRYIVAGLTMGAVKS